MRSKDCPVRKEEICGGLRILGLGPGDCVGVHSSLSSFGWVEGGADAVIDALLEVVGPAGTIVMPTYSTNREEVPRTEEDERLGVTWKWRVLPFDPAREPVWTGRIPDTFWRRQEAVRGTHPTHSLAAIGPRAGELCQGWDRLLDADGYILLLGVGLGCCSSMHLAEREVELPEGILRKITAPRELEERYRRENVHFGYGPYPAFGRMEGPCRQHGIIKETVIGEAKVKLVRLRELVGLYADCLRTDPDRFYGSGGQG